MTPSRLPIFGILSLAFVIGCGDKDDTATDDTSVVADDTDAGDDTGEEVITGDPSDIAQSVDDGATQNVLSTTTTLYNADGMLSGVSGDTTTGSSTYEVVEEGTTLCDADVNLAGAAYAGDCEGCDFAFEITATVADDGGYADCSMNPVLTMVPDAIIVNQIANFAEVYTYAGYYGNDYYYNALRIGISADYTSYGYGYYAGPYWQLRFHDDSAYGSAYVASDNLYWSYYREYVYEETEANYYNYCDYIYSSYASAAYGGVEGTGGIDCAGDVLDVWTVDALEGSDIKVTVDTVADDTAFDPYFTITDPDGCTVVFADDSFDCTYTPAAYQCPSVEYEAEATGTYTIEVRSYGSCNGDVADYKLSVDAIH